jgi:hypothetical protein
MNGWMNDEFKKGLSKAAVIVQSGIFLALPEKPQNLIRSAGFPAGIQKETSQI